MKYYIPLILMVILLSSIIIVVVESSEGSEDLSKLILRSLPFVRYLLIKCHLNISLSITNPTNVTYIDYVHYLSYTYTLINQCLERTNITPKRLVQLEEVIKSLSLLMPIKVKKIFNESRTKNLSLTLREVAFRHLQHHVNKELSSIYELMLKHINYLDVVLHHLILKGDVRHAFTLRILIDKVRDYLIDLDSMKENITKAGTDLNSILSTARHLRMLNSEYERRYAVGIECIYRLWKLATVLESMTIRQLLNETLYLALNTSRKSIETLTSNLITMFGNDCKGYCSALRALCLNKVPGTVYLTKEQSTTICRFYDVLCREEVIRKLYSILSILKTEVNHDLTRLIEMLNKGSSIILAKLRYRYNAYLYELCNISSTLKRGGIVFESLNNLIMMLKEVVELRS